MTDPERLAWSCITVDGNPPGAFGFSGWAPETQHKKIVEAFLSIRQEAVKEERERCAKVADERARIMNILGSDKDLVRKMTHACIQAERVYEAKTIAEAIRRGEG